MDQVSKRVLLVNTPLLVPLRVQLALLDMHVLRRETLLPALRGQLLRAGNPLAVLALWEANILWL